MPQPTPEIITNEQRKTQYAPLYAIILWDSPDHTFEYVIGMMRAIFGMSQADAMEVAVIVHTEGRANCGAFSQTEATEKRDKIHAYGPDPNVPRCAGSMYATLERIDPDG